ncbi:MAG: hypothetical protein B6D59_06720 [Campylobacteraceae bacterium 4484_4]|nr:MAG: hypothetical protein B6D59_06720 [Campylobacteraceae bacterium 4484_4]
MKNRLIITITDIHGSRQYTLHQFIKSFAKWIAIAIVLLIGLGALYLQTLEKRLSRIDSEAKALQQKQADLIAEKERLQRRIDRKTQMLESMDEQLSEIEKMVGLTPNVEETFSARANQAKKKTLERIDEARLSAAQIALLNQSIPNGKPVTSIRISDGYGYRIHPFTKKRQFHAGIDLIAKEGTPIYAPADGVVEFAQRKGNYGKFIMISHAFGFKTAYGHLKQFAVKEGEYITKGSLIGYVGNTGRSTGPHLHYEVRYLYKWLDPVPFLHWSSKTYGEVMRKTNNQVDWNALLAQVQRHIEVTKVWNETKMAQLLNLQNQRRKDGPVRE